MIAIVKNMPPYIIMSVIKCPALIDITCNKRPPD